MYVLFAILFACGPKKMTPDPAAQTRADQIFSKHVKAIGGERNLLKRKSVRIEGKIRRMDQQSEYRFITVKSAPDQLRSTVKTVGGDTAIQRGTDGRLFWIWSSGKYRAATPDEKKAIQKSADFYAPLNLNRHYPTVFSIEEIQFAGRSCHVVLAKDSHDNMVELFFDKELGFMRGYSEWKSANPENKRWTRFGHYVDIDGTKIPFSIEELNGKQHKLTLINSHKWDAPHKSIKAPKKLRSK